MNTLHRIRIDPEYYTNKDMEIISNIISDIIVDHHGGIAETIAFTIEVDYELRDDKDEEEHA